jgi:hypothetical protein
MVNQFAIATGGLKSSAILINLISTRGFTPLAEVSIQDGFSALGMYQIPPPCTINGVVCNVTAFSRVLYARKNKSKIPSNDFNPIEDLDFDGLEITISGNESTRAAYDQILEEFFKEGDHIFIFRGGWQYYLKTTEAVQQEDIGFMTSFPWEVKAITETPYQYSTELITRTKEVTSSELSWSADDDGKLLIAGGSLGAVADITITSHSTEHVFYSKTEVWT